MDDTLENPFFILSPLSRAQLRKVDLLGGGGKSEVFQKGSGNSGAEGNAEDNRAVRGDWAEPCSLPAQAHPALTALSSASSGN